jgi:glucose-6-phosphate isomerase
MNNLKYDFSNLFADSIGEQHGLKQSDVEGLHDKAKKSHEKLSETRARGDIGFYDLPNDKANAEQILEVKKLICSRFENLVVLGIGGSALGVRCLENALLPPYYNMLPARGRRGCPRLFVCDNVDPDAFEPLLEILDWKQTCINVVSKSGRTTETISQFFMTKDILVRKFGGEKWRDHVIVTTDPNTGPLRRIAREEKLRSFSVPVNVGGRFSVLSSVGLLPAACAGVDIKALLDGAADAAKAYSEFDLENNPVYMNAVIHYLYDTLKSVRISVMMPYSSLLEKFSDWYAQLLAESLGKEGKGPTPVKAVGVTDQHSQLQLYMEGPRDKVLTILGVEQFERNTTLQKNLPEPFEYLSSHSLSEILKAEERATSNSLKEAGRPHLSLTMKKVDEYGLGALLMAYQIQIAYMGMLYDINPFNQPGVELSKKLTKEILSK